MTRPDVPTMDDDEWAAIEEGLEDIEQGRVYTLEEVEADLLQRFPFLTRAKEKAALANERAK